MNASVERYRVDLAWPALRLGIEYDGRQHRDDLDRWDHDITRNEWFEARGWRLIHVVSRDLYQRPGATIERIRRTYLEQGGAPFPVDPEWRRHFPEWRAAAA